ncbi:hypothetical protein AGR13a_Cc30156 [Agrobacterium genomosp. 13 str. CFBP 6927]|uniref:Uncharacterized protein n=1 Tax=Agrobacterium genomosp. 13 str. CFBP 6927 TaxID=1183428 RepID=A0ABP2BGS1_9HYPH|nr:hypothetical protein AGR13a_Cc30156 [Agrobacterium genomosp. 13 str. CFBP 6927]
MGFPYAHSLPHGGYLFLHRVEDAPQIGGVKFSYFGL